MRAEEDDDRQAEDLHAAEEWVEELAVAKVDRGKDPKVGSSKSEFLSGMNEQGEKSASSKCKFTR